ncbi:UNVERIFIED_CONTAM: NhaP-type Na+/H+ and K+/H+ antiporter [Paenibacillus sp. PvR008]
MSLSTLGVIITTVVIGVCAKFILGVSRMESMLLEPDAAP